MCPTSGEQHVLIGHYLSPCQPPCATATAASNGADSSVGSAMVHADPVSIQGFQPRFQLHAPSACSDPRPRQACMADYMRRVSFQQHSAMLAQGVQVLRVAQLQRAGTLPAVISPPGRALDARLCAQACGGCQAGGGHHQLRRRLRAVSAAAARAVLCRRHGPGAVRLPFQIPLSFLSPATLSAPAGARASPLR